jgi:hypothetical protein
LPIFFELVSPVVSLYELLYASTKAEWTFFKKKIWNITLKRFA